jgi:DNA-binding GntR family transcriptional regulator
MREDIIAGVLPTGARLTIADLVARYQVSQMPVREALQSLAGEGLITLLPHKGASVVEIGPKFVRNAFEMCEVIEGLLARLSVAHITRAALAELEKQHLQIADEMGRGRIEEAYSLNRQFHRTLYEHADNPLAFEIYERYSALMSIMRRTHGVSEQRKKAVIEEHANLIDVIRSGDEIAAEKTARAHNRGSKEDVLAQIQKPV